MELSKAIRKRIKYYLDKNDMNVWNLCKNSGIPCSTISTFMSGRTELIKLILFFISVMALILHLENFSQMNFLVILITKQIKTNSFSMLLVFFIF